MAYKCIIIDDSSVHRLAISFLIKNHPQLELVGSYSDPYEGIDAMYEHQADIIMLDVLLENVDAFQLLDKMDIPAEIIINSSWEKFSSKAKKYGIRNFLMKPMRKDAFEQAISGVLKSFEGKEEKKTFNHTPYLMPKPNVFSSKENFL